MDKSDKLQNNQQLGYGPVAAVIMTVGVYFASQVAVGLVIVAAAKLIGWDIDQLQNWVADRSAAQFVTILAIEAITLGLIFQFMRGRKTPLSAIGLIRPRSRDIGYALVGYLVYSAIVFAATILAKALLPEVDFEQRQEIGFSTNIAGPALLFVFASLVLLPAVTEEIVMRGFLYTGLRSKMPKIAAAIVVGLLFAVAHLQWGSGNALVWVAAMDTFVMSFMLVYLREKTGSLWSPIGVHFMKNGIAFLLLFVLKIA